MPQRKYKRRKKLIKPHLQLKLTVTFVGLVALSLLLQFVLFTNTMTRAALELPNDSVLLLEASHGILLRDLAIAFLVFLPLTFFVGILSTFRVAGPLYRFEKFLESLQRGERPPDFRLRKGDELHDLAELLNQATAPMRKGDEEEAEDEVSPDAPPSLVRDETTSESPSSSERR